MSSANGQQTYALILYDGDEVYTALADFAKRHAVTAAHSAGRSRAAGWNRRLLSFGCPGEQLQEGGIQFHGDRQ